MARYFKILLLVQLLIFSFNVFAGSTSVEVKKIDSTSAWHEINNNALLIDVRTVDEFNSGHIDGAINIPHNQLESRLSEVDSNKGREIILYCKSGKRAGIAGDVLVKNGYTKVFNAGGYADLRDHKAGS
ncbi:MAG: rhodanese-like domain-containing protein [Deltaproteobacteria bacterium]|nr:rhodanese-like domain-containing protein [Deltaproteobacteria bacterium]